MLLRGLGAAAAAAAGAGRGPGPGAAPGRLLRRLSPAAGGGDGGEYAADLAGIRAAAERLAGYARETPVLTSRTLDEMAGRKLVFKAEIFQKGGSFKFRGSFNSVASLSPEQLARGVVTHSSGNHAAAVALAAQMKGAEAHIVVPRTAPKVKLTAVREYGGQVHLCEPTMDAREAAMEEIRARTGAHFIAPYNYGPTICGQGTIATELLEQAPELDCVVVPVSGGGMISGIATAVKALRPDCAVLAAEPVGLNGVADVALAKAAGELAEVPKTQTIADGLQARLGDLTWPIVRDKVDAVVTVTEAEIVAAMKLCFERMKVVVEPSGAVGLAAVLTEAFRREWGERKNVGVILCGGNADLEAKGFWDLWRLEEA